jgi:hypothetical protein
MKKQNESEVVADTEQLRYAGILQKGVITGFIFIIITFVLYAWGIIEPYVPLEDFSVSCRQDVQSYLAEHGIGTGWNWIHLLLYGDFINYIGIIIFTGITIICYVSIVPLLLRKREWVIVAIVLAEVALLITVSSGLLNF